MNIGDRMRLKRRELDMTQEDVSKFIGTSKQTVQRYESGEISNIPSDKIELIAKILRTTPSYLMGWDETKEDKKIIYKSEEHKVAIEAISDLSPEDLKIVMDMVNRMKK